MEITLFIMENHGILFLNFCGNPVKVFTCCLHCLLMSIYKMLGINRLNWSFLIGCLFQRNSSEFEKQKQTLEDSQAQITSLEHSKSWLERRLAETEVSTSNDEHFFRIFPEIPKFDVSLKILNYVDYNDFSDLLSVYLKRINI